MSSHRIFTASLLLLAVACISRLSGCSGDKSTLGPMDPEFRYPLQIGSIWEYESTWTMVYYSIAGDTANTEVLRSSTSVEVIRTDSLSGHIPLYLFREIHIDFFSEAIHESDSYYSNLDDGFYRHATSGTNFRAVPKTTAVPPGHSMERILSLPRDLIGPAGISISGISTFPDSIYYEDPPLKVLPYPVGRGLRWEYRSHGNEFRIDKRVTGRETITSPAGVYECYKVQWLYDYDGDGEWDSNLVAFDYISENGLIKRYFAAVDMDWTDAIGESLGTSDSIEEYLLVEITAGDR